MSLLKRLVEAVRGGRKSLEDARLYLAEYDRVNGTSMLSEFDSTYPDTPPDTPPSGDSVPSETEPEPEPLASKRRSRRR